MNKQRLDFILFSFVALVILSCSGDKQPRKTPEGNTSGAGTSATSNQPGMAQSSHYYVLEKKLKTIFEIDLSNNKVSRKFALDDDVVAIAYDMDKEWVYEAIGGPLPGLKILDPKQSKVIHSFDFPQPPSDILFHPIKRELYITSEDSTDFRIFMPDSLKTKFEYPLWITGGRPVGPRTLSPGPANRIYTANGARASVSVLTTDNNYAYQTVLLKGAKFIDNAVSSFDGNSSYCCDSKQGKIFRVEFGTGNILGEKSGLNNPRLIQFEVDSRTVVVVVDKATVLMLNSDSFAETGKVDLSEYGDEILSLFIPPKSNYAELTMDSKGVTRWLRLDIRTWAPTRMVELY
jgi:hypothetical protein